MREPLQAWFNANRAKKDDDRLDGRDNQVIFVRDTLAQVVSMGLTYEHRCDPYVISTHTSKSMLLPVYEFHREDLGIRLTLRGNFYNWMVSVESKQPVEIDSTDLFDSYAEISRCYCEGFPSGRVFTSYAKRTEYKMGMAVSHNFTVELGSSYDVYAFMLLLLRPRFPKTGRFIERK